MFSFFWGVICPGNIPRAPIQWQAQCKEPGLQRTWTHDGDRRTSAALDSGAAEVYLGVRGAVGGGLDMTGVLRRWHRGSLDVQ